MSKKFDAFDKAHTDFIAAQHMFFVATAAPEGRVNLSPKGMDSLRVLGPNRVAWLNITGSGNETAGHLLESPRMTLMWCSFEKRPLILRAYGTARAIHRRDDDWTEMSGLFKSHRSARQVFDVTVDLVQTSCGYVVPFMDYAGERPTMDHWVDQRSDDDFVAYWAEKNAVTLDGKPTGTP